uniref:Glycosyl transferase family 2 n=1 Tax=Nitratidesulfovibrio vulgaris (strain DSM 19637 / Miyazaki F) TaxID=883 RepID=B8DS91_NITV9
MSIAPETPREAARPDVTVTPDATDALLAAYTATVLGFRLGGAGQEKPADDVPGLPRPDADAPQQAVRQAADKAVRLALRSGRPHLVLLGTGDGALPEAVCAALNAAASAAGRPASATVPRLTLCDLAPDRMRTALASGLLRDFTAPTPAPDAPRLLADTSPWALLLLLRGTGVTPETATLVPNPFLPEAETEALHRWRRLFAGCVPVTLTHAEQDARQHPGEGADRPPHLAGLTDPTGLADLADLPDLGVGAILHPAEPDLPAFFAQVPGWVREMAVVWDGAPPDFDPIPLCPVPLRQAVRPLGGDFSAQRNAMLGLLSTQWCLYLDADERLEPHAWALLPRLMAVPGAGAWLLPRATAYPDADHLRVGYGLWPDVQLRLFRRMPGVCFRGAVHERVVGVHGHTCLLGDVWIDHLSWTAKDRDALAERLRVFNAAGAGQAAPAPSGGLHRLSTEYPALPRSLFAHAGLVSGDSARPARDSAELRDTEAAAHRHHLALRLPLSP